MGRKNVFSAVADTSFYGWLIILYTHTHMSVYSRSEVLLGIVTRAHVKCAPSKPHSVRDQIKKIFTR